jgi:hypothetical protein
MVTYITIADDLIQYVGESANKAFSISEEFKMQGKSVYIEIWESEELVCQIEPTLEQSIK